MDSSADELREQPETDSGADSGSSNIRSADHHPEQAMEGNEILRDNERTPTTPNTHIVANESVSTAEDGSRRAIEVAAEHESNPTLDGQSLVNNEIDEANARTPAAPVADAARLQDNDQIVMDANQPQAQEQTADTENGNTCKICFTSLAAEDFIYLNCGCLYCVECLNAHFRSGLANRASYPPRCCDQLPIDIEAIQGFLNDENMIRYTMVQEEFAADRPLYCANRECGIEFIADAVDIDVHSDNRMVICYGCALETCARCRELRDAHTDNDGVMECPDSLALAEVKDIAEEKKWRRCPGCGFLVEKIDGCDHMICDCQMEFHYVCGEEYGNDGRCGCVINHGWVDGEDGEDGGGWEQNLVDQLAQDVHDDLHRLPEFPFEAPALLEHVMEGVEVLLMASVDGDNASGIAATRTADEEVIAGEGPRLTAGAEQVAEAGGQNHAVEGEEHGVDARPADRMEEDNEGEDHAAEDMNLQVATETLRTALAGFRDATQGLRAAAAAVVNGRRRRAGRALRALEQANRPRGAMGGGRGFRGRGRGRGGQGGAIVPHAFNNEGGDGEE